MVNMKNLLMKMDRFKKYMINILVKVPKCFFEIIKMYIIMRKKKFLVLFYFNNIGGDILCNYHILMI